MARPSIELRFMTEQEIAARKFTGWLIATRWSVGGTEHSWHNFIEELTPRQLADELASASSAIKATL